MKVSGSTYYCIIFLVMFSAGITRAQQQPMYTQYMFNGLVLNPAYAGSAETFTATALFRKQWVGMTGAPETQTFSAHSPVDDLVNRRRPGSPVSLGVTVFHDRIAITGQTGLLAAYAYRVRTGRNASLSLGLQGGFSHYRIQYSDLELDDPSFSTGDVMEWQPEFGAGVYFKTTRFYAGMSLPQMLRPAIERNNTNISLAPHLFISTGYVFDAGRDVKIKPNALLKTSKGAFQLDLNCNVFLKEIINFGVSWRSEESVSSLVQLQVNPRFAVGYAYDLGYGSEFSRLSNGSHEMMVSYRVPKKNVRTINPRFF